MRHVEIFTLSKFERRYKKLPLRIKIKAEERERVFVSSPFDARLNTHKLHGKDRDLWAYSVDNRYRIKFIFLDDHRVLYLDIGTHDEVY